MTRPGALAARVGRACLARGWTLAVAESCTGGLLGGALTAVPGSSRYFAGGVVAYDNRVKSSLLGVPQGTLLDKGAVSAEAATAMAEGVRRLLSADAGMAVTGVAGPGASERKPAGTVWVAAALPGLGRSRLLRLQGGRQAVRRAAVAEAMLLFLELAEGEGR